MTPTTQSAFRLIQTRMGLSLGFTHPNGPKIASIVFVDLRQAGELLDAGEIEAYALRHGWTPADAKSLGELWKMVGKERQAA